MHRASHLSPRQTWQEVHISVELAQLCIVVSMIEVTATRLFLARVFPSVGQDLRNNQTKAGYPEGFRRVYHPFMLLL